MKYAKRILALLLVCSFALLVLSGCNAGSTGSDTGNTGAESITIRYGSADAEGTAIVTGIYAFKDYVEEASGGTIKVEPYVNGVLGGDREMCEGLQLGTVDMTVVLGGILANYDEAFNVFGLPYLWDSKQASYDAVDGEFGSTMVERADGIGFKLLGYGDGGTYHVGYKGTPRQSVSDFKGMKLRVPEIDMDIKFFTALGAAPMPISFSETYTAIEQGVVNGLELSVELMYFSQYFETIDCITETAHTQCVFPILMSQSMWNSLNTEQQKIVMDGIAKQVEANRAGAEAAEDTYKDEFIKSGKQVYTPDEGTMSELRAIGQQVQNEYLDIIGADIIESAKASN